MNSLKDHSVPLSYSWPYSLHQELQRRADMVEGDERGNRSAYTKRMIFQGLEVERAKNTGLPQSS